MSLGLRRGLGIRFLHSRISSSGLNGIYIVNNGVLSNDINFSRSSTATYVGSDGLIKIASSNEARTDYDPVTLQLRGVLLEEQRTNLIRRSEAFDVTPWANANVNITTNATLSPDGTSNASLLARGNTSSSSYTSQQPGLGVSAGNQLVFSVFAKQANIGNLFGMRIQGSYPHRADVVFDLSDGSVHDSAVNTATITDAYTEDFGNGWYRCVLIATITSSSVAVVVLGPTDSSRTAGVWEASTSTLNEAYVWGAQAEQTTQKQSSYIPTTSTTFARTLDDTYTTPIDFLNFNQTEGSLFLEAEETPNLIGFNRYISFGEDGVSVATKEICIISDAANQLAKLRVQNSSSIQANVSSTALIDDVTFKFACSWKENDFEIAVNGSSEGTDTLGTVPTNVNRMEVGRGNSLYVNNRIKNLVYYPVRLTQQQMENLTS